MAPHRILELFSGIGGMHFAWKESGLDGDVVAAADINTLANKVYSHNFKNTKVLNRNIQSFTADFINSLSPDTILMSPPCQPFTRNGLMKDTKDVRSFPFSYLLSILKDLRTVEYVLMENVKGFEISNMRDTFIKTLSECNFFYEEYLLSPSQFGIPNSRLRYYCLARRRPFNDSNGKLMLTLYDEEKECFPISSILERNPDMSCYLKNKCLKRAQVLDICYSNSRRSCCFTKAYTHFLEGTGSVYTEFSEEDTYKIFNKCANISIESDQFYNNVSKLNLRFFTPKEVSRLMAFPVCFQFPAGTTPKQCYRLLGNSINVKVVSELIKRLLT